MAKGSAMGLWRGKKGSTVFYRLKNSSNSQKQGIRERVYEVSNPRTSKQAGQRMKLLPAQRFSNMFKSIIDRAFEGVDYGIKSRQEFMRYALKMQSGFPYVEKDDVRIWPGQYLVSCGTLPRITCDITAGGGEVAQSSLPLTTELLTTETIGAYSRALLNANQWLIEGDQLTCIAIIGIDNGTLEEAITVPAQCSFYIDTTSTENMPASNFVISQENDHLAMSIDSAKGDFILGAAIILSRDSSTGGHLRSLSYMATLPELDDIIFSASAMQRARRSYQNKVKTNANWELVPGSGVTVDEETETAEYTIQTVNSSTYQAAVGQKVLVLKGVETGNVLGTYFAMFEGQQVLVAPNGQPLTITGSEMQELGVPASVVPALAGLPSVIYT